MEDLSLLLLISILCATIFIFIFLFGYQTSNSAKLPPGPRPFPIIGNILELGSQPHQTLANLSKIYGPIMTLKLGNRTTIVISSAEAAKEVLHKNDQVFSNRTIPDTPRALDHHILSMVWMAPSAQWRALRKACATKVFSSQQLDFTHLLRERKVKELLNFVDQSCKKGEALDIGEAAFTTVLNSISNTLFSVDLAHYTSDKLQEFKDIIWGIMEEAGKPNVVDFFPILRVLDPQGARARMTKYFGRLIDIFDSLVEERLRLWDSKMDSEVCKDVLDSILALMIQDNSQLSRPHVLHLFLDLFVAGIDTTSSTIEWVMAELLHNPEKLAEARKEVQQVLYEDEQLEESHISKLPFIQAAVKETLRLHPPAPLLVPHKAENDVHLYDFIVPKNAQILVNLWAMGRDSNTWENPDRFIPERFLGSNINFKGFDFELIPFGAGRRICPGLPMASRTVPFIIASLLHKYDWKLADELNAEDMDMSEQYGLTMHKLQSLRAIPIKASYHSFITLMEKH